MFQNEQNAIVASLNISRSDARDAALTMLRNSSTVGEIRANDKLASGTLNAYLLGAIRDGWKADCIESFRADAYKSATERGIKVNTKSNSLLTATSRASNFAKRPDAQSIADRASTLSEALRIAKDVDAANAHAADEQKAHEEALIREERAQRERDETAVKLAQSIEEDKVSGRYQADLIASIRRQIAELESLGVVVEFSVAE